MKKSILFAVFVMASASVSANADLSSNNMIGKILNSGHDNINIEFLTKDTLVLKTPCYHAEGNYRIDQGESNKMVFALQNYTNVTNACVNDAKLSGVVNTALHSLVWNESFDVKLNSDFSVGFNMYSENGSIHSYSM